MARVFRFVRFEPLLGLRGLSFLHNTAIFGSMPWHPLNSAGHPYSLSGRRRCRKAKETGKGYLRLCRRERKLLGAPHPAGGGQVELCTLVTEEVGVMPTKLVEQERAEGKPLQPWGPMELGDLWAGTVPIPWNVRDASGDRATLSGQPALTCLPRQPPAGPAFQAKYFFFLLLFLRLLV
jgi:hypothetical protein